MANSNAPVSTALAFVEIASTEEQTRLILAEQVKLLYAHAPLSQVMVLLNAAVLGGVLWPVTSHLVLLAWLCAMATVSLVRLAMVRAYRRAAPPVPEAMRWGERFLAGTALSGVLWGSVAVFLFPAGNIAHQVFIAFVLAGLVSGATLALSSVFKAFLAFSLPALVPVTAQFLLQGSEIHYAMGWMALLYTVAIIVIARRIHETLTDSLRLRHENDALIAKLRQAQDALREANADLEKRVVERTQALSQANADLEKFAYVASHDLQEPLRTVTNFAELLARRYRGRLGQDADEFIGFIVGAAARMRQLIDSLLVFYRADSRGGNVPGAADGSAVLKRVLENLKAAIEESGAAVTHDLLPTVAMSGEQLEQLFQNLISNAIKFRKGAAPRIHVGARAAGSEWIFSVRDDGIGIDPQHFDRIFEPFQRLHGMGRYPGTGVGLAICKKIVERHQGRLWLESREGKGATFYFSLPRKEDDASP